MKNRIGILFLLVLSMAAVGCEDTAASTKLDIVVEGLGPKDVSRGQLTAFVQLEGTCSLGPCDPNPCLTEETEKTRCIAQGSVYRCDCPAGTSLTIEEMVETCMPDTGCTPTYCGGNGICEENMEGVPACICNAGYIGANCDQCDEMLGFFPDGFGGCLDEFDVCRAGQGGEEYMAFLAEAEEALGHPASEIELISATISVVEDSASGARNWPYLFSNNVNVVFEPTDEPIITAASGDVPGEGAGLVPIDPTVVVDRPTFTRQPKFFEGDFAIGVQGSTERIGNEPFSLDVNLVLEFEAY